MAVAGIGYVASASQSIADVDHQAATYDQLAAVAAAKGDISRALQYYQRKHQLSADLTRADALTMAVLYDRQGDKTNAIAQYQLAIDYYKAKQKNAANAATIEDLHARIFVLQS
jgi:hypothetical protein